jgi:HPt (histidine-containing phosphotransfer) domain-containing protein
MSGSIDDALNHLKTCTRDTDHARTSAAAALDRTRTAQERAGQAGFLGVARHLDRPIRSLEGHPPQLAQLASTIEQAIAQLSEITADLTPAEVLTRLRAAKKLVGSALDQASDAIVACADARDQVNLALQGGHPDEILGILEDERRTLADVIKSLTAADAAVDKAIGEAENVGTG